MVSEVGHISSNQIDINHIKWLKQNGASYSEAIRNSERPAVFCEQRCIPESPKQHLRPGPSIQIFLNPQLFLSGFKNVRTLSDLLQIYYFPLWRADSKLSELIIHQIFSLVRDWSKRVT